MNDRREVLIKVFTQKKKVCESSHECNFHVTDDRKSLTSLSASQFDLSFQTFQGKLFLFPAKKEFVGSCCGDSPSLFCGMFVTILMFQY